MATAGATDNQSLQSFISRVKSIGMPMASHFSIVIGPPSAGGGAGPTASESVMMLCNTANLPGYSHMTTELRRYGEIIEMPYGIAYPDLNLTFYVDNTLETKNFFDFWSQSIFDKQTRAIGYYNTFVRPIDLFLHNKLGDVIYHAKLYECYPKNIGDFEVGNDIEGILRLTVTMKYKWLEIKYANLKGNSSSVPPEYDSSNDKNTVNAENAAAREAFRRAEIESRNLSENAAETIKYKFGTPNNIFGDSLFDTSSLSEKYGFSTGTPNKSLYDWGSYVGTGIPQAGSGLVSSLNAAGLPSNMATSTTGFSNSIASVSGQIQKMAALPNQVYSLSSNLSNSVKQLANSASSMGNTFAANGLQNAMSSANGPLYEIANQMSGQASLNSLKGPVSSLGSHIGYLGGQVASMQSSGNTPSSVMSQLSSFGGVVSKAGSSLSSIMGGF